MIKLSNFNEYYVDTETDFETCVLRELLDMYVKGATDKIKEIDVEIVDNNLIRIEATDESIVYVKRIINTFHQTLADHEEAIIRAYCQKQGYEYKE